MYASSLREIHVSIIGTSDDYAVEVVSGAWFGSILFPGAVALIVGGPIGLAGGAAIAAIIAYEFERNMWRKILEVVKKESKVNLQSSLLTIIMHLLHNLLACATQDATRAVDRQ